MKMLLFISRVAFICNVCMVVGFVMRYVQIITNKDAQSTIIIAGFFLSVLFNILVAFGMLILILRKQRQRINPRWLFATNFLCLIFQLYFMLQ